MSEVIFSSLFVCLVMIVFATIILEAPKGVIKWATVLVLVVGTLWLLSIIWSPL